MLKLRSQHEWLLFFTIPKQLLLYQLIQQWKGENNEETVYQLLREVTFLVSNNPPTIEQLRKQIEVNEWDFLHLTSVKLFFHKNVEGCRD